MNKSLKVFLIHGTWGSSSEWKDEGSWFRESFQKKAKGLYGDNIEYEAIPWSGLNRWKARSRVAEALAKKLERSVEGTAAGTRILVIAHSHGGNVATVAVRNCLKRNPDAPIDGVICLSTPFLTQEMRATSGYLKFWASLVLILLACFLILSTTNLTDTAGTTAASLWQAALAVPLLLIPAGLALFLYVIGYISSRTVQQGFNDLRDDWSVRPNVLCISCPDDEAITFLGLGEGVANLMHLLLHPVGMIFALSLSLVAIDFSEGLRWCGSSPSCLESQVLALLSVVSLWIGASLAGNLVGSFAISVMFGLPLLESMRLLVSRVLVSHTPLRPAHSYFASVADVPHKWGNPIQLLHSQIYRSPQVIELMGDWLTYLSKHEKLESRPMEVYVPHESAG